jgi:hypothetical protein
MSVDFLLPADLTFPPEVRKAAIVNNVSAPSGDFLARGDTLPQLGETERKTEYFSGDAALTAQALAEALAQQNYFDQVLICDSVLRADDASPRDERLSRTETAELAATLGADVLVALENLQIKTTRTVGVDMGGGGYWGTVEAQPLLRLTLYVPTRTMPMASFVVRDSIYWDDWQYSPSRLVTATLPDTTIIREASDYAGAMPMKYLTPYWETARRYFFTDGNADFRDAGYLLTNGKWDAAAAIWQRVFQQGKTKKKKQMFAAFNLALYYELTEDYARAQTFLEQAEQIRVANDYAMPSVEVLFAQYGVQLELHAAAATKLKLQMQRFDADP